MNTTKNEHASEVLNDLLKINNDRITGYRKASDETKESDLKTIFRKMETESEILATTLTKEVAKLGANPETGATTNSGKIYRLWMNVKATFSGHDRKSILNACEFGEDAAQKAYRDALDDQQLPAGIKTIIRLQKDQLKLAHDTIKSLRDRAN